VVYVDTSVDHRDVKGIDNDVHLSQIWRYPVKSMSGERLTRAELTDAGVTGDRIVQVYDR
jgi:hypothetical protein